jgi:hypothetical protein
MAPTPQPLFYVADERSELVPIVAAPANVFDLMAGWRPEGWRSFIEPPPPRPNISVRAARRLRSAVHRWLGK